MHDSVVDQHPGLAWSTLNCETHVYFSMHGLILVVLSKHIKVCLDFFKKEVHCVNFYFWSMSFLLGVGLAMDAFSISVANGLKEPEMKIKKSIIISGIFGFFQGVMPFLGWVFVRTIISQFEFVGKIIPYISFVLLVFLGIKMLFDTKNEHESSKESIALSMILIQGIATSIDALSVGTILVNYNFIEVIVSSCVICVVTFIICLFGVILGEKLSLKLSNKASIVGGVILILMGLEMLISSFI